jgi:mRNA-degrading endonuclease toxin of MazEF toxin-antitoxin module
MQRGEVYLVDLEPARGSAANKTRPAVLVSNNAADSKALAEQVRSVDYARRVHLAL